MCNCRYQCNCRRYGFFNFCLDVFMMTVTLGFWFFWILIREIRNS